MVHNSRVALLVDTSLSMGLNDAEAGSPGGAPSRLRQVAAALAETDFLAALCRTHDVSIHQFNNSLDRDRVVSLAKLPSKRTSIEENSSPPDWRKFLRPGGTETRLGEALQQLIHEERGASLAGIVLLSDGGQNAGAGPEAAVEMAREGKTPIFVVGLGSDKKARNVRINELAAPVRAYPGDHYAATGYIQAQGLAGRLATVQLLSRDADTRGDRARRGTGKIEASRQVILGGDGEITPVRFELAADKPGRRTLCLRVISPEGDRDAADKFREADVEVVERKNHILLMAGGPSREYQFLRTLLARDRSVAVDLLLQTAQEGVSQEGNAILHQFPSTREQMSAYDCVVAFDPNWQALSAVEVEALYDWVDSQGGGLIVSAGPVFAGKGVSSWLQDPAMAKIRSLYPVEFPRQYGLDVDFSYATREPWPLEFSREGLEADFLWLGEGPSASRQAWAEFAGVHSYFQVRGPKPAAAVLATFSDPARARAENNRPTSSRSSTVRGGCFTWAAQRCGGSAAPTPAYFEQFYTKLIRHVSQGRLLRGSRRGVLLVGQDRYLLGNTAEVRAQLTNARLQPLIAPSVPLEYFAPDGTMKRIELAADGSRPGAFAGRFPLLQEGDYRLELPVPESAERLLSRLQVKVPELERENPQRNDALLARIAAQTGGKYYIGMPAALSKSVPQPLVESLADRTMIERAVVASDPRWEETWLRWLLIAICGVLCLEWLIRRLMKLA